MPSPRELTIGSWNMWCFNERFEEALEFIRTADCDIFSLQEVPEAFLPVIEELPYHVATAFDSEWTSSPPIHLVLLSKYPIREVTRVSLPNYPYSWRSYATRLLMKLVMRTNPDALANHETLRARVALPEGAITVANIHLPLLFPSIRREEFLLAREGAEPNIICGDFNILEHWWVKPLNWMQGGRLAEALPWYNERKQFDPLFEKAGLKNPLAGLVTHKISGSQLDHILVPNDTEILERKVISDTHGSDHNPVLVRIRLK